MNEEPSLTYIHKIATGNSEFESKLIQILKIEFPQEQKVYLAHISNRDYQKAAPLVHKVKNKFSLLNLVEGYSLANEYENDLKEENLNKRLIFEEVLGAVERFLDSI